MRLRACFFAAVGLAAVLSLAAQSSADADDALPIIDYKSISTERNVTVPIFKGLSASYDRIVGGLYDNMSSSPLASSSTAAYVSGVAPSGPIVVGTVGESSPTPAKAAPRPPKPDPFSYGLSIESSFPFGHIGSSATSLRGATQGFVGYQIDPYTKFTADYYQIPFYPLGTSGTSVPLVIRGSSTPIGSVALPGTASNSDVYKFLNLGLQRTFLIAKKHPLIVTPGFIFPVFQYDDAVTIEGNGQALPIKIRSYAYKYVALTIPVVYNRHCLVLLTGQTKWLVRTNGLNETNHPQEVLIAYSEYFANRKTSFFFQPSRYIVYLPSDRAPEYSFTAEYGINYRFTKNLWSQIEIESLNPSGTGPNGIANLTCSTAACTSILPTIGSLKTAEVHLSIGIGSPFVIPI
jgi:hypothetical protein